MNSDEIRKNIKEINDKNKIGTRRIREELTRVNLKQILKGLISERSHKLLADEIGVSRDLIVDVVQDFEIETPSKARRLLAEVESMNDNPPPKWIKDRSLSSIKAVPVLQEKPKEQTGGKYDKVAIEKRFNAQQANLKVSSVPLEENHRFTQNIDFGWRRMQTLYGNSSDLNFSNEDLKSEIMLKRPNILLEDPGYFEQEVFNGEEE